MRNLAPLAAALALLVVPVTALASDSPSSPASPTAHTTPHGTSRAGAVLDLSGRGGLPKVGDRHAHAREAAGVARDVALAAPAIVTQRPTAGRRALARMNVPRVMNELDAALQECTAGGGSPSTRVALRLSVTPAGAVESADAADGSTVRPEVLSCVISVMTGAQFRPLGGAGASITVSIALAARAASAAPQAASTPAADAKPAAVALATTSE